jgi:hypothetical protein
MIGSYTAALINPNVPCRSQLKPIILPGRDKAKSFVGKIISATGG